MWEYAVARHEWDEAAGLFALEIYSWFGWNDPPQKELEEAQQKRLGSSLHL